MALTPMLIMILLTDFLIVGSLMLVGAAAIAYLKSEVTPQD